MASPLQWNIQTPVPSLGLVRADGALFLLLFVLIFMFPTFSNQYVTVALQVIGVHDGSTFALTLLRLMLHSSQDCTSPEISGILCYII